MMRMLLILTLFLPIFSCKKKSGSSDTPTTAVAPTSCEAYSPSGNNLDLAGAALTPLPAIDATQLQVDSLKVTVAPYKSGKDNFNALSFEVVGKSTSNVNLVSDYLQYKVCMEQNGSGGQQCLCNNGTSTCPYQANPAGNATSALFNEYSTGDYQVSDPYTTSWEVPVPVALSGVLSTTARLCVRDNRKTSGANCGPWAPAVLRQVSKNYTQALGQLKQTIQQISTEQGVLAFSLVESAKTYQQALSSIPYANQNNEERSLSLYASNFINFPDSTRQVLQNRDLYTEMLQEVQTAAAGGSSTGLAGGTTASCAPVAAAIQSITSSPGTDPTVSTLTETVVYTYTENGTLTSTIVEVAPGETTTVTINSTETATIVGPTVTQTNTVTETDTTPGETVAVTSPALLEALQKAAKDVVASAEDMKRKADALQPEAVDQGSATAAQTAATTALDNANVAKTKAQDSDADLTIAALSQAQRDLTAAATALAVAQQAIGATKAKAESETQNAAAQVTSITAKVTGVSDRLEAQQTIFDDIPTDYNLSFANDQMKQLVADAKAAWKIADDKLVTASGLLAIANTNLKIITGTEGTEGTEGTKPTITKATVFDANEAEITANGAVDVATVAVQTAQQTAETAAAAINSIENRLNNSVVKGAGATAALGLIITIYFGRKLDVARQANKNITMQQRADIYNYREYNNRIKGLNDTYAGLVKKRSRFLIESVNKLNDYYNVEKGRDFKAVEQEFHKRINYQDKISEFDRSIKVLKEKLETVKSEPFEKPATMEKSTGWAKVGLAVGVAMVVGGILVGVLKALNIGALNLATASPQEQANLTFLTAMTQLQNRYQALNTALDACNLELTSELAVAGTATLANCRMP